MLDITPNITTLVVLLIVFISTYFVLKWLDIFTGRKQPPGPWGLPIVGHLPFFGRSPPRTFMNWAYQYGNVYRIRMGSWDTVVLNGYSAVKEAAEKLDDAFSGRPNFVSKQLIENRLGVEDFAFGNFSPHYLLRRKRTAKAMRLFTNVRKQFVEELVHEEVDKLATSLVAKYETEAGSVEFDVQIAVASTMYHILYGKDKQIDNEKHVRVIADNIQQFNELTGSGNPLDVMPWLRYIMPWKTRALSQITGLSDKIIFDQVQQHHQTFKKNKIRDMTDAIMAEGFASEECNSKRLLFNSPHLLITLANLQGAGFDTTHKTVLWLILYMASFPDVQTRVQGELDYVVGRDRHVELEDQPRLVYTDATIHEVMRIVTMLPLALPHYAIKDSTVQGYDVPKDTVIIFNLYSVSHEKEFWVDPQSFRPDRFINTDGVLNTQNANRIFPFGLGRRRCVGEHLAKMNLFIFFSTLMQKCSFAKPEGCVLSLDPIPALTYSPKEFQVLVKAR